MNILPKKSWHVRTKANIERVRKDEAKAADEEKEKQRRIAVAEQEARTAVLRQRAEQRAVASGSGQVKPSEGSVTEPEKADSSPSKEAFPTPSKDVKVFEEGKHINFWSEFEEGKPTTTGNEEYEREKKQEQEKQEQAIGLLTYLGQSSAERLATKPWYQQPREARVHSQEDTVSNKKNEDEIDKKRKRASDPMRNMSDYLEKKRKIDEQSNPSEKPKEKKNKHKHKHSQKESKKNSGPKTMEQLRAERLQREKAERAKAEALMAKMRGEKTESEPKVELDERQRGYNSQFNPELVRKRKPKHSYH